MVMSMDAGGDQTMSLPIEDITMSGIAGGAQNSQESADEDINEDEQSSKASGQTVVNNNQQQRQQGQVMRKISSKINNQSDSKQKEMVVSREASLGDQMEEKGSMHDVDIDNSANEINESDVNKSNNSIAQQQQQKEFLSSKMELREKLADKSDVVTIKNDPLVARMREFVEGTTTTLQNIESPERKEDLNADGENKQPKSSSDSINNQAETNSKASNESAQQQQQQQQQKRSHRHHHSRSHCARYHHHQHQHHHQQLHRLSVTSIGCAQQQNKPATTLSNSGTSAPDAQIATASSSSGMTGHHSYPHHHHHHNAAHNQQQTTNESNQTGSQHIHSHSHSHAPPHHSHHHHHHHQHAHLHGSAAAVNGNGTVSHNRHHHHHHHHHNHHRVHKKRLISDDQTGSGGADFNALILSTTTTTTNEQNDLTKQAEEVDNSSTRQELATSSSALMNEKENTTTNKEQNIRAILQDVTSQSNLIGTAASASSSSYCPYHGLSASSTNTTANQHQHHNHCSVHSKSLAFKHHHHHHHHHHQNLQQQSTGNLEASGEHLGSVEQQHQQQEMIQGDESGQIKKILHHDQSYLIRGHNHHYHNHHKHHHQHQHQHHGHGSHSHGHHHGHHHHHHHHHHQHNNQRLRHRNKNRSSSNTNIIGELQQDSNKDQTNKIDNSIVNEKKTKSSPDEQEQIQQESDNENKMNLDQSDEESKRRHIDLIHKSNYNNKASSEVVRMDLSLNNEQSTTVTKQMTPGDEVSITKQTKIDNGGVLRSNNLINNSSVNDNNDNNNNSKQQISTTTTTTTTTTLRNEQKANINSHPPSGLINAQELEGKVRELSRNKEGDSFKGKRNAALCEGVIGDGEASSADMCNANKDSLLRQMSSSRENSQKGPSGAQGAGRTDGAGGNRDGSNNRRQQEEQQHQTIECVPIQPNTYQQSEMPKQIIESTVLRDRRCKLCWCCCCPCSSSSNKSNSIKSEVKQSNEPAMTTTPNKCPSIPNVSLDEIRSWGESFDKLMKCPDGRKIFQDFLRCEYSEENILFWIACEDLKSEKDAKSVANKARDIYEDYISILSAKEVSLDSRVRDVINSNIKKPTSNIFDEAQLQIYTLMHRDSYPRFLNSAMFKRLAQIQTTSRKSSS